MLKIKKLKIEIYIRLYGSCNIDFGRSIAESTQLVGLNRLADTIIK